MVQKKLIQREATKRKILHYQHPKPNVALATEEQSRSAATFEAWRKQLSEEMLDDRSWVEAFRDVARKSAEKEETAAQHAPVRKWERWKKQNPRSPVRLGSTGTWWQGST